MLEVNTVMRGTLEPESSTPISIAITGYSGNVISSFTKHCGQLGRRRGISPHHPDSLLLLFFLHSKTGAVGHAWNRGFPAKPEELNYLEEMHFSQYKLFIISVSELFSMNVMKLAQIIQSLGKRFYTIWTKLERTTAQVPSGRNGSCSISRKSPEGMGA